MNRSWSNLQRLLGGSAEPVSVTFCDTPPVGTPRVGQAAPAGCAYWKLAAQGQTFYTAAADHLNCPIGAYTHGAELTPEANAQLNGLIEQMVGIQYLKMEEVSGIPHRVQPLRYAVYAPLSKTEGTPDVVLVRGNAKQLMLLAEAATASGLMSPTQAMGRPACSVVAATMESGKVTTSLGCVGNRVYTDLADDEFYAAVPGASVQRVVDALETMVEANAKLEEFHRGRCAC
jgi:uncharacterized protein (DUF169 family)